MGSDGSGCSTGHMSQTRSHRRAMSLAKQSPVLSSCHGGDLVPGWDLVAMREAVIDRKMPPGLAKDTSSFKMRGRVNNDTWWLL